jgi:hypothetical protein
MIKYSMLPVALMIVFLFINPNPIVAASQPLNVNIVVNTYLLSSGNAGYFVASGPAVDAGLICPTGTATDIYNRGQGWESNIGTNYFVLKQFVCDNGSGTFTLQLEARVVYPDKDTANWNVKSGTGPYAGLHGTGKDVGEFHFDSNGNPIYITDNISGKIH